MLSERAPSVLQVPSQTRRTADLSGGQLAVVSVPWFDWARVSRDGAASRDAYLRARLAAAGVGA
jgi:hypothetical protein